MRNFELILKNRVTEPVVLPRGFAGLMFALGLNAEGVLTFTPQQLSGRTNYRFVGDSFEYGVDTRGAALANLRFVCSRSVSNLGSSLSRKYVRRSAQSLVAMVGRGSSVGSLSFRSVYGIARVMSRYNAKLARSGGWWGPYAFTSVHHRHPGRTFFYRAAPYAAKITPLGRGAHSKVLRESIREYRRVPRYKKLWRSIKNLNPNRKRRSTRFGKFSPGMNRLFVRFFQKAYKGLCGPRQFRSRSHRTEFRVRYMSVFWAGVRLKYSGSRRFPRHWFNTIKHITLRSQKTKWFSRRQGSMNWRINSRKFGALRTGSMYGGSVAYVAGVASGSSWARVFKYKFPRTFVFIKKDTARLRLVQSKVVLRLKSRRRKGRSMQRAYKVAMQMRNLFYRARTRVHALLAASTHRWAAMGQLSDFAEKNMSIYRVLTYCGFSLVSSHKLSPVTVAFRPEREPSYVPDHFSRADHVTAVYSNRVNAGRAPKLNRWFSYVAQKRSTLVRELNGRLLGGIVRPGERLRKTSLPFTYRNRVVTAAETYLAKGIISQAQTGYTRRFSELITASFAADGGMSHAMWDHTSKNGIVCNNHRPLVNTPLCGPRYTRRCFDLGTFRKVGNLVTYPNNPKGFYAFGGECFSPRLPRAKLTNKIQQMFPVPGGTGGYNITDGRSWSKAPDAGLHVWNHVRSVVSGGWSAYAENAADRMSLSGYISTLDTQKGRLLWYLGTSLVAGAMSEYESGRPALARESLGWCGRSVIVNGMRFVQRNEVIGLRAPAPTSQTTSDLVKYRLAYLALRRNTPQSEINKEFFKRVGDKRIRGFYKFLRATKKLRFKLFLKARVAKLFPWTTTVVQKNVGLSYTRYPSPVRARRGYMDLLTALPVSTPEGLSRVAAHLAKTRLLVRLETQTFRLPGDGSGNLQELRELTQRVKSITQSARYSRKFLDTRKAVRHRLTGMSRTTGFSSGLSVRQLRLQRYVDGILSLSKKARTAFTPAIVATQRSGTAKLRAAQRALLAEGRALGAITGGNVDLARTRKAQCRHLQTNVLLDWANKRLPKDKEAEASKAAQPYTEQRTVVGANGFSIRTGFKEIGKRRVGYFGRMGVHGKKTK